MIVLDASVVVDLLLGLPPHNVTTADLMRAHRPHLFAPHLLDAEVGQVIRRRVAGGTLSVSDAQTSLRTLNGLPIQRYPHGPFLERAFQLRDNVTIYDALYLVLAEALGADLVTRDGALAGVPGCSARVSVLS